MNVKKLLFPVVLSLACFSASLFGQAAETTKKVAKKVAEKTVDGAKTAAKKTAEGAKVVGEKTVDVSKDAAKATAKGTEKVAEKTVDVSKDAAKATKKGAEKTAEVTKDAVTPKKKTEVPAAAAMTGGTASASEIASAKSKGLVWVNLDSKIYHKEGQHYGTTKNGKFMTEAEATKMGAVASKSSAKK
jgi:hypothetical protein